MLSLCISNILGHKSIWVIGSSIVYWAHRRAHSRNGGVNLGLQNSGVIIRWFGQRGMLWSDLNAKISKLKEQYPPPGMIIIQLGSNDLCTEKSVELIHNIERDILRMMILFPDTKIIWSDILMRRYWHSACNGKAIEKARLRVNCATNKFIVEHGQIIIHHPNIRAKEKNLYRFDGTHLSDIGNDIYLNNMQGAIEKIQKSGI